MSPRQIHPNPAASLSPRFWDQLPAQLGFSRLERWESCAPSLQVFKGISLPAGASAAAPGVPQNQGDGQGWGAGSVSGEIPAFVLEM